MASHKQAVWEFNTSRVGNLETHAHNTGRESNPEHMETGAGYAIYGRGEAPPAGTFDEDSGFRTRMYKAQGTREMPSVRR